MSLKFQYSTTARFYYIILTINFVRYFTQLYKLEF
jgi:hypothetical protein